MLEGNLDHELLKELLERHTNWELSSAEVIYANRCWIDVEPDHRGFWGDFKKRFDPDLEKALKLNAFTKGRVCPEFSSVQQLLTWLAECTGDKTFLLILFID